eukprot:g47730.t1
MLLLHFLWEIREQSSVPDNYVCRKCDQLQLLTDCVVRLEKQLDTQCCKQKAERVIDTSIREVDTPQVQTDRWVTARKETWLKEGQDWQLNIPGYRCFRQDRKGNKRGGRVALLIREHIIVVLREDTSEGSCCEALWMELRNTKGKITMLGVFYRPPNSPWEIEEQICSQILERSKRVARERVSPLKDRGGKLSVEPQEVGVILTEYLVSVFTKEKDMTDVE